MKIKISKGLVSSHSCECSIFDFYPENEYKLQNYIRVKSRVIKKSEAAKNLKSDEYQISGD